jgi:hypothetical protein
MVFRRTSDSRQKATWSALVSSFWLACLVVLSMATTSRRSTCSAFTVPATLTTTSWTSRSSPHQERAGCLVRPPSLWGRNAAASNDDNADAEGASLASELFKMAQKKGVAISKDDLLDDEAEDEDEETETVEDDDDDEEDDEPEANYPQGAVNAFLGYDTGITSSDDKLAGNVTLTNTQLYSEVKERVLDTAGGFVQFVKGASDDENENDDEDEDEGEDEMVVAGGASRMKQEKYTPPTTVPDSELTAGEVVLLILQALVHNDDPTKNRGVEILFGYSSAGSQIKNEVGLTPAEYAEFLKETEYKVLFTHDPDEAVRMTHDLATWWCRS